jgi:hypothetical protein
MTAAEQREMTHGKDMQVSLAEPLARKAVGELLLAHLDKEASRCGEAALRSAINFRANYIKRVKDL